LFIPVLLNFHHTYLQSDCRHCSIGRSVGFISIDLVLVVFYIYFFNAHVVVSRLPNVIYLCIYFAFIL